MLIQRDFGRVIALHSADGGQFDNFDDKFFGTYFQLVTCDI